MKNKYFSYSFQISNTRKIIIVFFLFVIILGITYAFFIHSKTNKENTGGLEYKKVLGMEEFDDNNCKSAYRVYYEKKTCGSICINVTTKNNDYIKNKKKEMEKSGFSTTDIETKRINSNKWSYFYTKNAGPIFNYYSLEKNDKLYTLELINQSTNFTRNTKNKCNENFKKILNSLSV